MAQEAGLFTSGPSCSFCLELHLKGGRAFTRWPVMGGRCRASVLTGASSECCCRTDEETGREWASGGSSLGPSAGEAGDELLWPVTGLVK